MFTRQHTIPPLADFEKIHGPITTTGLNNATQLHTRWRHPC
jgi:hypothetical protein